MIRVKLHRRARAPVSRLLVVMLVVVTVGGAVGGGLYWLDQRHPLQRVWREFWSDPPRVAQVETPGAEGTPDGDSLAADSQRVVSADTSATAAGPAGIGSLVATGLKPLSRTAAGAEPRAQQVQRPAAGALPALAEGHDRDTGVEPGQPLTPAQAGSATRPDAAASTRSGPAAFRLQPRRSAACQWALRAAARLPAGTQLTALTCQASGEYSMEGTSASQRPVETFMQTLQQLPSQVDLSWWRSGAPGRPGPESLHFTFHGRFGDVQGDELDVLSPTQAKQLWSKVSQWCQEAALDEISSGDPIRNEAGPGVFQVRRKLWATGSYGQANAFLRQLRQVRDVAALGEVVMVPGNARPGGPEQARLYCALDYLVRRD
jgi:hypothetical protein